VKKNKRKKIKVISPQEIIDTAQIVSGISPESATEYREQLLQSQPFLMEFFEKVESDNLPHKKLLNDLMLTVYLSVASSTRALIPKIQFQTIDQTLEKYTAAIKRVSSLSASEEPSSVDVEILLAGDSQPQLFSYVLERLDEYSCAEEGMIRCFFRIAVEVLGRRCV